MEKAAAYLSGMGTFLLLHSCAMNGYGPGSGWGHMMYYGTGGMFMWIILLILLAAVIYFAASSSGRKGPQSPLDILKGRYAKGEITKEEFERMKKDISEP